MYVVEYIRLTYGIVETTWEASTEVSLYSLPSLGTLVTANFTGLQDLSKFVKALFT